MLGFDNRRTGEEPLNVGRYVFEVVTADHILGSAELRRVEPGGYCNVSDRIVTGDPVLAIQFFVQHSQKTDRLIVAAFAGARVLWLGASDRTASRFTWVALRGARWGSQAGPISSSAMEAVTPLGVGNE